MIKIGKQRGKQEISTVCMSFAKKIFSSIVFAALFVFQLSVRTDRGMRILGRKWTGVDKEREGMNTGRNVRTPFIDDPYSKYTPIYQTTLTFSSLGELSEEFLIKTRARKNPPAINLLPYHWIIIKYNKVLSLCFIFISMCSWCS